MSADFQTETGGRKNAKENNPSPTPAGGLPAEKTGRPETTGGIAPTARRKPAK